MLSVPPEVFRTRRPEADEPIRSPRQGPRPGLPPRDPRDRARRRGRPGPAQADGSRAPGRRARRQVPGPGARRLVEPPVAAPAAAAAGGAGRVGSAGALLLLSAGFERKRLAVAIPLGLAGGVLLAAGLAPVILSRLPAPGAGGPQGTGTVETAELRSLLALRRALTQAEGAVPAAAPPETRAAGIAGKLARLAVIYDHLAAAREEFRTGWQLEPAPREELLADRPLLTVLLGDLQIRKLVHLAGAEEPVVACAGVSQRAIAMPAGFRARLLGQPLRLDRRQSPLRLPGPCHP